MCVLDLGAGEMESVCDTQGLICEQIDARTEIAGGSVVVAGEVGVWLSSP